MTHTARNSSGLRRLPIFRNTGPRTFARATVRSASALVHPVRFRAVVAGIVMLSGFAVPGGVAPSASAAPPDHPKDGPPRMNPERMREMIKRAKARDKAPPLGAEAPDFTLQTRDGKKTVTLSSFRGKKPVVLVFGSYT